MATLDVIEQALRNGAFAAEMILRHPGYGAIHGLVVVGGGYDQVA